MTFKLNIGWGETLTLIYSLIHHMIKLFSPKQITVYDKKIYDAFITIATEEEQKIISKSLLKNKVYFINNSNKIELYRRFFELYVVEWVYEYNWSIILSKKIHSENTKLTSFIKDSFLCLPDWKFILENQAVLVTKDIEKYLEEKNRVEREKYFKKYIWGKRDKKLKQVKERAIEKFDNVMYNLILSLPEETINKLLTDPRITAEGIQIWDTTYWKKDIYKYILTDQKSLLSFYKLFKTWDIESILDYIIQWLKK